MPRGRPKAVPKLKRTPISADIMLSLLKMGGLIGVALVAPGVLRIFKNVNRSSDWNLYYPSSVERTAGRLYRRGLVTIKYEDGSPVVSITEKGHTEKLKYDLAHLTLSRPKHWDGIWRIVIFDIPERYGSMRNLFREKLRTLGFYRLQKSVFITPWPCEKEILYIREVLSIPHEIRLLHTTKVDNQNDLRLFFNI